MRRRAPWFWLAMVVMAGAGWRSWPARPPSRALAVDRAPRMAPDYTDLTIPPNIAPLNLRLAEPGRGVVARLNGGAGRPLTVRGSGHVVAWPLGAWHRLLAANAGQTLTLDLWVRGGGGWQKFAPVRWEVAAEPIDDHLVYRWFQPSYTGNTAVGIYQRDLTSFRQRPILRSGSTGQRCFNCHAFDQGDPRRFSLQLRGGSHEPKMVLVDGRQARTIATTDQRHKRPAATTTWHPSGRWAVCSRNWIRQYFHEAGSPGRDALDADSGLTLVDTRTGTLSDPPELNPPGYLPTFPAWSPDGRWLYFSRVKRTWPESLTMPLAEQPSIRYDLVRASFDPDRGAWGGIEMVISAQQAGGSLLEPRVSPNGRWLVATLAEYGGFPIFRARADLVTIDLDRRPWQAERLDPADPSRRETWHSWSSNSRWLVNSRKSDNGLFARPYLRYIAPDGRAGKPFILPQADPDYYDHLLYTYNLPELVRGPVAIGERDLLRALGPQHRSSAERAGPSL